MLALCEDSNLSLRLTAAAVDRLSKEQELAEKAGNAPSPGICAVSFLVSWYV